MEKYGTPQIVNKEDGIYKVSSKKLNKCCVDTLSKTLPEKRASCECGNVIELEKLED